MCPLCVWAQGEHRHSSLDTDTIDPMKEAILSEVTVQGITGTQRLKDSPSPFMVVTPRELNTLTGSNIVDQISHKPGLAQITTGAGISKPIIRGLGYNRVVAVEQGIRQEGQQWGDEHGLEVDGEGVHSVEVLKGPASLMYGSDAIAGVMILHPAPSLEAGLMQVKVGGEYQSNNNMRNYHVGFAGALPSGNNGGKWVWNWHYNSKDAQNYKNDHDGKVRNSWFDERNVMGMLGTERQWGHSLVRFSNVNFKPGMIGKELAHQKIRHTKVVSDNQWNIGTGKLLAIVGYQNNYRREYEETGTGTGSELCSPEHLWSARTGTGIALAMRLNTINYDLKYQWSLGAATLAEPWKLAVGVGGMWQQNKNEGEEALIPDYRLFDLGGFVTAGKKLGDWHLSGGVRLDRRWLNAFTSSEYGFEGLRKNFNGMSGSIGTVWNVTDRLNLRLNVASGFRAPTVSELCADGEHEGTFQYEVGNHKLKSEHSFQTDLGLDYTTQHVSLQASFFWNRISNYVFLARTGNWRVDVPEFKYGQGNASLIGGEVGIDVHPIEQLHIENTFSFVRGRFLGSALECKDLPKMPAPRWNVNVKYLFPDFAHGLCRRTYVSAGMEYNLRQETYYYTDDTETATPDYGIVNLSAGMDLHVFGNNCIQVSLTCQNLFDKVYQNHLSRLKYVVEEDSGERYTIYGMGRNFCIKVNVPINIRL